jgi:hypothetical protein
VGSGFDSVIFVGRISSTIGVEGLRKGDGSTTVLLATCFGAGAAFGVDFAGVAFLGVTGLGMGNGDDARRFAADSRRSRAGKTRL